MILKRVEAMNFSLLRDTAIDLHDGLTVITGASGAGKTLLFDAIGFALGNRAHRNLLPEGASSGQVTLWIELYDSEAAGAPWQVGENILVRRLSSTGSGRITLNGVPVRASDIQPIVERYLEITGQFESRVLFDPRSHLGLLESFGDPSLGRHRASYREAYDRHAKLTHALNTLRESAANRSQEIDFLTYQVEELGKAGVKAAEKQEVETKLTLQRNALQLTSAARTAAQLLSGDDEQRGSYDLAAAAVNQIEQLESLLGTNAGGFEPGQVLEEARQAISLLQELAAQLREFADGIEYDPAQEQQLTDRIDEILRLERKYGVEAKVLPDLLAEKETRLTILTDSTQTPEALERDLAEAEVELASIAAQLTKARKTAAKRLVEATIAYLRRLDFPDVQFEVELRSAGRLRSDGADEIEFLVSLNPGEPPRALAQVASGGEASRLFLALKAALSDRMETRILLLDEIEAGLGGDTARHVAEVLAELASSRQIMAITHLPVVAVVGQTHLVVTKQAARGQSSVTIAPVIGAERKAELVRMLGSQDTAEAQALVERMLES